MLCELRRLLILMSVHASVMDDLSFWGPVCFSKLSQFGKETSRKGRHCSFDAQKEQTHVTF